VAGPLKHDRDLSKLRDAYGIKDGDWSEATLLEERIKGVVNVDDATHLLRPSPIRFGIFRCFLAAGAGVYGGALFSVASPGGCYVQFISHQTGSLFYSTTAFVAQIAPAAKTADYVAFTDMAPVSEVLLAATAAPIVGPQSGAFARLTGPYFLDYGERLQLGNGTVNQDAAFDLIVQEIP
jgi:hypothetical protein